MIWSEGVERALRRRFPRLDVHMQRDFLTPNRWVAFGYRIDPGVAYLGIYGSTDKNSFVNEASKKLLRECYPYREFPVH